MMDRIFFLPHFAKKFYGVSDKGGCAVSMSVDVIPRPFICNIHLSQTDQNFIGADIVIFGDMGLQ